MHLILFVLIIVNVSSNIILSEYEQCNAPLGMESGLITDSDLTSSSTHDVSSVGPQMARIRIEYEGGAWCPAKPIGPKSFEYIQIELHKLFFLNAIETQGRFDNGHGNEFAEYYQIQYQRENNSSNWIYYYNKKTNKTIIRGNINTYVPEKRFLSSPIIAKRIRIIPYSLRWRTVCMRIELYGCPFYGGVISYTTSPTIEKDNTYDGGLGKLTDGILGGDDKAWIGWNKSPVLLKFYFDTSRHFKTIRIYSMNNKYRTIQIKFDNFSPINHQISFTETSLSTVFVDRIQLDKYQTMNIGKQVEILIEFDTDFLFLTEIIFDNEPALLVNTTFINLNSSTNCPIACSPLNNNLTLISTSSSMYHFEWLTILIISILCFCFVLLLIILILRVRRCSSHKKADIYYKCSTSNGSAIENERNHLNIDDMTSNGSYIYPITSTTSLIHTSSPSSMFKSEQYAVIDWPTNKTFHYASSDIGDIPSKLISLFNCIALQESVPSRSNYSLLPSVDQTKLFTLCKISESKYGEIFLGKYLMSKSVLIKIIKPNLINASRQRFLSELNVLSRLNHVNIAGVCGIQLDLLYFIQEHSDFGTLQDYFHTNIEESTFQKMNIYFSHQLSNALEYLSDLKIIHNDIATRNCLFFSDYTIKLTDCAMALTQYENEYWLCTNGEKIPLRWIAPEALTNKPTLKSDIYSFGVTLWELWSRCSYLPHGSLTNEEFYHYIVMRQSSYKIENPHDCIFRLSQPNDCSKEIYDLLCECWHVDGTKRPNISDISLYFRRQINIS